MSAQEPELERIIRDYSAMVQGALLRLGVPRPQLEDAAQEVFLVLFRRFGEFDSQRSLASWLWGIARGVASTHRRSAWRRERLAVAACAEPRREQPSAEDAVARSQAHSMLRVFLESLDEDKCAVFVLSEIEGCTGPEISARLHVNVNTVYARLRAARRRFEAAVAERRKRSQLVPAWVGFRWALPQVAKASLSTAMAAAIVLPSFEGVTRPTSTPLSEGPTMDTRVTEVVATTRSGPEPAKVEVGTETSLMTKTIPALVFTAALTLPALAHARAPKPGKASVSDQDADDAALVANLETRAYIFDGDTVDGEGHGPAGDNITARVSVHHESLIRIRGHFIPELVTLAMDI